MATGVTDCDMKSAVSVTVSSNDVDIQQSAEILKAVSTKPPRLPIEASLNGGAKRSETAIISLPESASTNNAAFDNLYFFEDEIYRIDKNGRVKFGLVVETSESYSGDEDDEFDDLPAKGEIRVAWHPDGKEETLPEKSVGLADRTIMPADVVRRSIPGKDTQRGYCRDISMLADVRILGSNYVVRDVNAERLRLTINWQLDTAVCLDSWVGSTKAIDESVVLRSTYGARFEVCSSGLYGFKDVNSSCRRGIFNNVTFYPGQIITGRLHSLEPIKLMTPDIPLKKNKKGKLLSGKYTVESVTTESVWVRWQCKALSEDYDMKTYEIEQPKSCVTGEDLKRLKRLNLFESCMQQINDRNYLKINDSDVILTKSDWDKEQAIKYGLLQKQQRELDELSRNIVYPANIASSGIAAGNHSLHYEKLKKKLHLLDADKSIKSKKLKMEKINKEKSEVMEKMHENVAAEKMAGSLKNTDDSKLLEIDGSMLSADGWISEEEDEFDNEENSNDDEAYRDIESEKSLYDGKDVKDGPTIISTCSTPTPRSSPKHKIGHWQWNKKAVSKKLKKIPVPSRVATTKKMPRAGAEVVTESLLLYSSATVVWQDGSIETGIPSTQLYPIHHLDTHEFFPGDFVISGKEDSDVSYRDYGVIQSVDHQGRIARVKWFTTYTSAEEAKPAYNGETEISVYDLKDHPDFQYRPGVMVIRVANFVGEDAACIAGQIVDNLTDGRVKVWWVDGHISMCWPQDLFEVGQYDQTDLGGNESDDSWETESENSEFGCNSPKITIAESHILSNIERACVAIARLEEFFLISPNLQNGEVMRKLLIVYKGCRYLDRLLNTNFFHEDNFMGLVERVRKCGAQTISERAQDRKNRLFNDTQVKPTAPKQQQQQKQQNCVCQAIVAVNIGNKGLDCSAQEYEGPKVLFNISGTSKILNSASSTSVDGKICQPTLTTATTTAAHTNLSTTAGNREHKHADHLLHLLTRSSIPDCNAAEVAMDIQNLSPSDLKSKGKTLNAEKSQLLSSAIHSIEQVYEQTSQLKTTAFLTQDDSGNCSRNENCDGSTTSYASSLDLTYAETINSPPGKTNNEQKSLSSSSIELTADSAPEVCVRLCSLLKEQLMKCIKEIRLKYYREDNLNLSEVFEYDMESEEKVIAQSRETSSKTNVDENEVVQSAKGEELKPADFVKENYSTAESEQYVSVALLDDVPFECFKVLPNAPNTHKFYLTMFHPNNAKQYFKAVQREHRMLRTSLPPDVWVRVFEDRMDLLSVMIGGPKKTPYEDGMFLFDIQLGREYPKSPPICQYISYCSDRLNPNLYEDGKVCVSLLGTWTGRDSEVWGPNSTLLQVIVSIQGLILVPEPYFNEAGYEKQKGTQQAVENSRMYNEMVVIKMVQATSKLLQTPPDIFREEIFEHYKLNGLCMYERIKGWMELSIAKDDSVKKSEGNLDYSPPEFPLVPASRGFCLTLAGLLESFHQRLALNYSSAVSERTSEATT